MDIAKYIHLLIDRSGSMRDKDKCPVPKIQVLKEIVKNYAHRWKKEDKNPNNLFGASSFSTNYTLIGVEKVHSNQFDNLICKIDNVKAAGGTNLYCSIFRALEDVNASIDRFCFQGCSILIVMTDGMETEFNCTLEDILDRKKVLYSMGKNIHLPIIGIGREGQRELEKLEGIADYRVGADSVEQLYQKIMRCIECSIRDYMNRCGC